jgi:hypothetical protein
VVTITPSTTIGQAKWIPSADPDAAGYPGGVLRFTPQDFDNPALKPGSMNLADEALLHELIHAVLDLCQVNQQQRLGIWPPPRIDQDYGNESPLGDFFAILVTNIYRSENQRPNLRSDHTDPPRMLPADLADPAGFVNCWRPVLMHLQGRLPTLINALANVHCPGQCRFNPFYVLQQQVKQRRRTGS